jgi:hypothetical protein
MSLIAYQEIDVRTGLEDRNMSSQLVIRDYQDTFDISKLEISHLLDCICSGTQSYSVENILVLLMNNLQEHLIWRTFSASSNFANGKALVPKPLFELCNPVEYQRWRACDNGLLHYRYLAGA